MASPCKLPPNPPKLPIIGNLYQILTKPRHQALWQLSKKYGPIMLFHMGSKPFIIISSPAMAKQIFKTQDHIFCSRPISKATKRLTYNYVDIAFSPQSNHRRDMRKILVSEFLGSKRARLFNHVLVTETASMIHFLSSRPSNIVVNLNELFLATTKAVICKVAFGKNYRQQPVNGPLWEVMIDETQEMFGGSLGDFFPWLGSFIDRFSGFDGRLEKCFANLDSYIETILDDHHNQNIEELSEDDKDFVHAIIELSSKQESNSAYRLTKDDVKALIMELQSVRGQFVAEQSGCFKLEVNVAELRQKLQTMDTLHKELEILQKQKAASEEAYAKQKQSSGGVWGWLAGTPPPTEKS